MRSVRVTGWGAPPEVREVPNPAPVTGHSIVRVEAATVGHLDRTIWSGAFLNPPPLPYTPGVEGAGTVIDGAMFEAGTRVWIRGCGLGVAFDGTWSELVSAPDQSMGVLPDDVSAEIGASFFSPCTSAWVSLHEIARVGPTDTVAVTGATGAVGAVAVQLALSVATAVIGCVSSNAAADSLPEGVIPHVTSDDSAWPDCDVLIDTVGGPVLATMLPRVRSGGRVVLIGYVAGSALELNLAELIQRNVALLPLNMLQRDTQGRAAAPALLKLLGDGRLTLSTTPFALAEAAAALGWLTERGHRGRAVLLPGAT